jgi:hypothetical protein
MMARRIVFDGAFAPKRDEAEETTNALAPNSKKLLLVVINNLSVGVPNFTVIE